MITIEVKNKEFNGERAGIAFANGVASVESITPEQEKFLKEMNYKIAGNLKEEKENNGSKKIEQMNKDELVAKAEELGIVIEDVKAVKKDEIIEMIKAKEEPQE